MAETLLVLVYCNGLITTSEDTIIFSSEYQSYFYVENDISYENLKRSIKESIETADNQGVSCIKYRLPISSGSGKICYRSFKLSNDRDVRMMFDYHKRNPDIGIIELYVEFRAATFEGYHSQQQTAPDDEVQRNMRRERISSPSEYGQSSGDDEDDDGDSFGEDTEASVDDIQLEECNLEDVPITGHNFTMAPMEPPAHMRTLDLEAMSAQEFLEYSLFYADTLSGATTNGDLHVGMRFRNKDDAVTAIKHYCLLKSVEYKVIESDLTRYSDKCKSYGDGCNWRVRASYSKRRQLWEITKYTGPHTCSLTMISQDHSKLDSNMISRQIQALVQQQPSINVSVLIAEIKNRYEYTPTFKIPRWLSELQ
ncbi:uncharacterized protein LOC120256615 [Dioscorea cayenensis subsp. rotundata]|uniref:Uncharacterized protein LOC120256615 n=1 Tax=Dioscorea cayennensis subsp. rotundata TaxID=55577 RepID=A0AB40AYW2_DIOCR|nr:uncharacterized protein LOC120256615 [Dioscorea cayenensis subsp. rotundata]